MKKIMFKDEYGLTQAVLEGRKTMTRRTFKITDYDIEYLDTAFDRDLRESVIIDRYSHYKVGEVVAVAQSYQTILDTVFADDQQWYHGYKREVEDAHELLLEDIPGRTNKMFVKAKKMPHAIRITNVRVERLQDISDEDCIREGIVKALGLYGCEGLCERGDQLYFNTPRTAFAALIDKVSGEGTWQSNPWVFVYEFELIK